MLYRNSEIMILQVFARVYQDMVYRFKYWKKYMFSIKRNDISIGYIQMICKGWKSKKLKVK